jgi:hypothetical protein
MTARRRKRPCDLGQFHSPRVLKAFEEGWRKSGAG